MLELKHISKKYGDHLAVDDLSFIIDGGKVYGFLGPNGAGKSTTMNIITGCLAASSGQVLIDGQDILEEPLEAKKCIGYLPEIPPLDIDQTVAEYLRFVGEMKGLRGKELEAQLSEVMLLTRIRDVANRLIRFLSKGYQQRVGIAQAILGEAKTIILDEPMVGLDPRQILEMRQLISKLKKDRTVLLSSHILSEVQEICDEIIIITGGRLIAFDTTENLKKRADFSSLEDVFISLTGECGGDEK